MVRTNDDGAVAKGMGAGFACILLAMALMGANGQAYAAKATEAADGSAFKLGRVSVECVDAEDPGDAEGRGEDVESIGAHDDAGAEGPDDEQDDMPDDGDVIAVSGCELTMGAPQERIYRISNQGEASYVRLASRTVSGELEHVNGLGVREEAASGTDADGSDEDGASEVGSDAMSDERGADGADGSGEGPDAPAQPDEAPLWRLADDGYWYRAVPLAAGETITVRVSVEIPFEEEWVAALSSGEPSAVIEILDVEALQARNKTIDADSSDPWGIGDADEGSDGTQGADGIENEEGDML